MKKLRLILFEECNRKCEGCCNKDWDLKSLPIIHDYKQFDMILLTGGEPLLCPTIVRTTIENIRRESKATIIIYTALVDSPLIFYALLELVDGITLTIHEQNDVPDFYVLCAILANSNITGKTMRLNVFEGITIQNIPSYWIVKKDMKWIKNCPLPEGEILGRLQ